ncbi:hypothetical protein R3P38DRAFT_2758559 [Favolaschia claudopus]|uniref:Uncharacterized protein n=1 Tax=Favolaschia claudopus TaxID=2862362 RepID=A0AAW0EDY5_9AGAR
MSRTPKHVLFVGTVSALGVPAQGAAHVAGQHVVYAEPTVASNESDQSLLDGRHHPPSPGVRHPARGGAFCPRLSGSGRRGGIRALSRRDRRVARPCEILKLTIPEWRDEHQRAVAGGREVTGSAAGGATNRTVPRQQCTFLFYASKEFEEDLRYGFSGRLFLFQLLQTCFRYKGVRVAEKPETIKSPGTGEVAATRRREQRLLCCNVTPVIVNCSNFFALNRFGAIRCDLRSNSHKMPPAAAVGPAHVTEGQWERVIPRMAIWVQCDAIEEPEAKRREIQIILFWTIYLSNTEGADRYARVLTATATS